MMMDDDDDDDDDWLIDDAWLIDWLIDWPTDWLIDYDGDNYDNDDDELSQINRPRASRLRPLEDSANGTLYLLWYALHVESWLPAAFYVINGYFFSPNSNIRGCQSRPWTSFFKLSYSQRSPMLFKPSLDTSLLQIKIDLINSSGNPTAVDLLIKFLTLVV